MINKILFIPSLSRSGNLFFDKRKGRFRNFPEKSAISLNWTYKIGKVKLYLCKVFVRRSKIFTGFWGLFWINTE